MKKGWLIGIVVVICCVLISGIYYINTANELTEMSNLAKKYEADVQTELQTRFEKVPNLVEIVKGAAQHEEKIIDSITDARAQYNKAFSTGDTAGMLEADTAITAAITRFEEDYPEIAAMDMYKGFMDEYSGIEAAVNTARKNYNDVVMEYNNKIQKIPASVVAKSRGFEPIEEFKASEKANDPVEIKMTD